MSEKCTPAQIREALQAVDLEESIIQEFGEADQKEYLIRVRRTDIQLSGLSEKVKAALSVQLGSDVEIRRVEMVGPKVGEDLRQKALFAIFYAILFIAIYISGRFELKWLMSIVMAIALALVVYVASIVGISVTWLIVIALIVTLALCWFLNLRYAMGAIIALIHDVTITIGFFALTDREISLSIIAAGLTILGYSLNDTIVVFDRIRENLRRFRRRPFEEIINTSINDTLSRTLLTSLTTLVVVVILFVLGGGVIHDFAFAIMIGIIVGTYSSIFVASPILLLWEGRLAGKTKGNKGA
jgi:preprotein translocase subunit SecF